MPVRNAAGASFNVNQDLPIFPEAKRAHCHDGTIQCGDRKPFRREVIQ